MPVDFPKKPMYYEIRIAGHLSQERAEWFGLSIRVKPGQEGMSETTLSGPFVDQAALFGILTHLRDLGLKLISVNQIEPGTENDSTVNEQEKEC